MHSTIIWLISISAIQTTSQNCLSSSSNNKPLILTELLRLGRINEARKASRVNLELFKSVKSYSGYFTVNKNYNSNQFFWFFPSEVNYRDAPVLLWLQGGPGSSSLLGLFEENGPFRVINGTVELAEYSWTKTHSVIYIDNPVGTGFSFTNGGYANNETQIGEELYIALQQFFVMFPELLSNAFYVTGESYAGKYVPAISYVIHKKNPTAAFKINLKGLFIGNGIFDLKYQINYGDYLYQLGLIDSDQQKLFKKSETEIVNHIMKKEFIEAYAHFYSFMLADVADFPTLLYNTTGLTGRYNYIDDSPGNSEHENFVQRVDVKRAIHVGNIDFKPFNISSSVNKHLQADLGKSITPWLRTLLSHYRVLLYNGQLDIIGAYPLMVNYLKNLEFRSSDEYKTAKRYKWYVEDDLAGYVKQAGNLTEIMVRNAGHLVPSDQPKWAYELINRFTSDAPFH